jgi:serine protease AprX
VIITAQPGRRGALAADLRAGGHTAKAQHPLINAITVEIPLSALEGLARNPNVRNISLNAETSAYTSVAPTGGVVRATLGLTSTSPTGTGVGVAVVDSGIAPSNVFGSRIVAFYDFTAGTARAAAPFDPYGHGTHVAGLIAGSGEPSGGRYPGTATGANLIGLRVLDGFGVGQTSQVISALEFAVANRQALGIDVINLSLGHPVFESTATDPLVQAVEAAVRAGIVVVASAGNFGRNPLTGEVGYAGIASPGNAPSAITVGALDTKGTITRTDDSVPSYSSRGPTWYDARVKPDVLAPGHLLTAVNSKSSLLYQLNPLARVTSIYDTVNGYLRLNGTSMAAGVASGVVAAMIQGHRDAKGTSAPKLSPNAIKAILQYSSIEVADAATGAPYDVLTQGVGAINARGAVAIARRIDMAASIGSYWMSSEPTPTLTLGTQVYSWTQRLIWGSHLVWGNSLYYHELAWEPQSVWGQGGDHLVWGNLDVEHLVWGNLIWADHVVWGNSLIGLADGDHIVWGNATDPDHLVWGNLDGDHLVWGNLADDHLVWGNGADDDHLVWGNSDEELYGAEDVVETTEVPLEP